MLTKWDNVSFIVRSGPRKKVFLALAEPKTPTQLSKELKLNVGFVSNIIIDLLKRDLIECLSPNEKRHRFYQISKNGQNLLKDLKK